MMGGGVAGRRGLALHLLGGRTASDAHRHAHGQHERHIAVQGAIRSWSALGPARKRRHEAEEALRED